MQFLLLLRSPSLESAIITALPCSCFSSVADVNRCYDHLASITFVTPFLNISIHSHILHHGNVLSPHSAHKSIWISALLTLSAHKILKTSLCSSSVQIERHTDMFTTQYLITHWWRGPATIKIRQPEYSVQSHQVSAAYQLPVHYQQQSAQTLQSTLV
jgi:hypothetical protein